MPTPWASWKSGAMILAAVAGLALAAVGYSAPRVPSSLSVGTAVASTGVGAGAATKPDPKAAATGATGAAASTGSAAATGAASGTSASGGGATASQRTSGAGTAGGGTAATGSAAGGRTQSGGTANGGTANGGSAGAGTAATSSATTSTAASAGGSAKATSAAATGPLLSQTQYAPYAYQIYPGTPSAAAQRALSGFKVSFQAQNGGKEQVTITVAGRSQHASFAASDRLYVVETNLGDDGFGQEMNFGDDGFVLTDAGGHLVGG